MLILVFKVAITARNLPARKSCLDPIESDARFAKVEKLWTIFMLTEEEAMRIMARQD